jgi:5'-3' exoribonuclease 2
MSFIRHQRIQKGYDPMTSHVVCGLDADLIMLALASHEPNFYILREKFFYKKKTAPGHFLRPFDPTAPALQAFEFVYVNELRALLDEEFRSIRYALSFGYHLERLLDDFVFLCFFVGNDFLPHLPCMTIYDGAIERLLRLYKVIPFSSWMI